MKKETVAVAVSGGVDSAVTAYLLKEEGYNVIGITMVLFKNPGFLEDAKKVCEFLGIKHHILHFEEDFNSKVINYFVDGYSKGETPNPCVKCNKVIKFGRLIKSAFELGADYFATGHYVKTINGSIYMSDNEKKDQSYFLALIDKKYISKVKFPLYKMDKADVRKIAKKIGLFVHDKKDSQEICFVDNKYSDYLRDYIEVDKPGDIVDKTGKIYGKHSGICKYTIGQRKGLGIAHESPLYVVGINFDKNEVIVGLDEDLFTDKLICNQVSFLEKIDLKNIENEKFLVKIRSRDILHVATLKMLSDTEIEILFDNMIRAITPGQLAAFYDFDKKLLGGGLIVKK